MGFMFMDCFLRFFQIIFNIAFIGICVAYPFLLYFGFSQIILIMAIFWGIKAILELLEKYKIYIFKAQNSKIESSIESKIDFGSKNGNKSNFGIESKRKISPFLSLFVCAIFALCAGLESEILSLIYPSLMSIFMLVIFATSLKNEAIITRLARLKEPQLPQEAVIYTRKITIIWCVFFALNAAICAALAFLQDRFFWSIYCGVISYCLMGALFAAEWLYRKFILKV